MSNTLLHKKVNAFGDSPNTNLVRPFDWNDEHIFAGGINGQLLSFNNTMSDNVEWINQPQLPLINIGDDPYNAPNDGSEDASIVIQAAFDDAKDAGGGFVIFPPGQYLVDGGAQHGGTGIALDGASNITIIGFGGELLAGNACGRLLGVYNSSNVRILGLKLIGNTFRVGDTFSQQLHGIAIGLGSAFVDVSHCYITNFLGDCIAIGGNFDNGTLTGYTSKYISIHNNILKERIGNGVKSISLGSGSRLCISANDVQHIMIHNNYIFGGVDLEPDADGQFIRQVSVKGNHFKNGPVSAQVQIGDEYNYDEGILNRGDPSGSSILGVLATNGVPGNPIVDGVVFEGNMFEDGVIITQLIYRAHVLNNFFERGVINIGATSGGNQTRDLVVSGNISNGLYTPTAQTAFINFVGLITFSKFINNHIIAPSGYVFKDLGTSTGDGGRNVFINNTNPSETAAGVFNFAENTGHKVFPLGPIATSVAANNWHYTGAAVEKLFTNDIAVATTEERIVELTLNTDGVLISGTTYDFDWRAHPGNVYLILTGAASLTLRNITNVPSGTQIQIINGIVGGNTLTVTHNSGILLDGDVDFIMNTVRDILTLRCRQSVLYETARIEQ